jgi:ribosomal protein S18 acetylase RimI-like enzyme
MSIPSSIIRVTEYYSRHGFRATIRRAGLAVRRELFARRMVVFYCELIKGSRPLAVPDFLSIDRLRTETELKPSDLQQMTSFWNPKLAHRNIRERFEHGASLWLIKSGDMLAGYGWTLQGRTIEPYYFPLAPDDVHLFDFHVFPQYRGRGINPYSVAHILDNLAMNCGGRAFIEAAEWNEAQLSSLRKTPFRRMGRARSFSLFGHTLVSWAGNDTAKQIHKGTERTARVPPIERAHEQ